MKKLILLFLATFILISCSPDDNLGNRYYYEILKIESYEVPTEFHSGITETITVRFKRPTTCHYYNNLYYHKDTNIRKIAIESIVEERDNCLALTESDNPEIEKTFNFQVLQAAGTEYLFRFYKGKNDAGESIFEDVTIPVID